MNGSNTKILISEAENMDEEEGKRVVDELMSLIDQWGFKGKFDHFIVCGWFLAQIVQSVWDWRPHLWFTGAQGSGKTLLTILFERLGGGLCRRFEGQTSEPGIRTDLGNNMFLTIVDEFEHSKHREAIIELCRSSNRGGTISKASPSQTNVKYQIRHMILLCSIEIGIRRAAENPRFIIVESKKDSARNPSIPGHDEIERLRIRLFAYAIWASKRAKALIQELNSFQGADKRFVESLAVVFSMIAVCDSDSKGTLNQMIEDYLKDWLKRQDGTFAEDEQTLLEDIMMANVRLPIKNQDGTMIGEERVIYDYRTVSQLIDDSRHSEDIHLTLQTHGIKVCEDGMFFHPKKVQRSLLQNTDWRQLSIREILLRVPGADPKARERLSGSRVRGVLISFESLSEYIGADGPDE